MGRGRERVAFADAAAAAAAAAAVAVAPAAVREGERRGREHAVVAAVDAIAVPGVLCRERPTGGSFTLCCCLAADGLPLSISGLDQGQAGRGAGLVSYAICVFLRSARYFAIIIYSL